MYKLVVTIYIKRNYLYKLFKFHKIICHYNRYYLLITTNFQYFYTEGKIKF